MYFSVSPKMLSIGKKNTLHGKVDHLNCVMLQDIVPKTALDFGPFFHSPFLFSMVCYHADKGSLWVIGCENAVQKT